MPRRDLTDVRALRALAHPLRHRMLTWLQTHGPATSAMLAERFGADRGATSYHLRQLARYGFLEEDTERSAGRRRYWRVVREDLRLPAPGGVADDETRAATETIRMLWQQQGERERARFQAEVDADPDAYGEFAAAALHSIGRLRLTAEQLRAFDEEYVALLQRWHSDHPAPDARNITVIAHAFPTPGESDER